MFGCCFTLSLCENPPGSNRFANDVVTLVGKQEFEIVFQASGKKADCLCRMAARLRGLIEKCLPEGNRMESMSLIQKVVYGGVYVRHIRLWDTIRSGPAKSEPFEG